MGILLFFKIDHPQGIKITGKLYGKHAVGIVAACVAKQTKIPGIISRLEFLFHKLPMMNEDHK